MQFYHGSMAFISRNKTSDKIIKVLHLVSVYYTFYVRILKKKKQGLKSSNDVPRGVRTIFSIGRIAKLLRLLFLSKSVNKIIYSAISRLTMVVIVKLAG